jgi:hypothetical protein
MAYTFQDADIDLDSFTAAYYFPSPVTLDKWTASCWIKIDSSGDLYASQYYIQMFRDDISNGAMCFMLDLYHHAENSLAITASKNFYSATDMEQVGYNVWPFIGDGLWHHIAVLADAGAVKSVIYIDGEAMDPAEEVWGTAAYALTLADTYGVALGNSVFDGIYVCDGSFCEQAVWTKHLTAEEIKALYQGTKPTELHRDSLILYTRGADDFDNFTKDPSYPTQPLDVEIVNNAGSVVSVASTSHAVALPTGRQVGDIVYIIGRTASGTVSAPAGWSLEVTSASAANGSLYMASKLLDGTESSPVTITCSASAKGVHQALLIRNGLYSSEFDTDYLTTSNRTGQYGGIFGPARWAISIEAASSRRTDPVFGGPSGYTALDVRLETAAASALTTECCLHVWAAPQRFIRASYPITTVSGTVNAARYTTVLAVAEETVNGYTPFGNNLHAPVYHNKRKANQRTLSKKVSSIEDALLENADLELQAE